MGEPHPVVVVAAPEDLGPSAVLAVADGAALRLCPSLLERLRRSREQTLAALAVAGPVYGVTTGMGLQADRAVALADHPSYQDDLMLARAVGTAPWLDRSTTRAVVATRLRTLLEPEVGISPGLAEALVDLLAADLHPAVPADGNGAAGEIIPLAHLGGFLTGSGEGLGPDGGTAPAAVLLQQHGVAPYSFGPKEGAAFLQGVPAATARAVMLGRQARLACAQAIAVTAAEVVLVRAPRDPYAPGLARGDSLLAEVHDALRALTGEEPAPRTLQAPVSLRVTGPALAQLLRSVRHLDESVHRALTGVTTSPALLEGRFLGTAGFDGFELAATMDAVRVAVLHLAETGTARLHRMLDPRVTGLTSQLSPAPGRQAGLVAIHKRAVGVVHAARRAAAPASLGAAETSLGQEDVQSFGLEGASALAEALDVLQDVTACELSAVHRAHQLDAALPKGTTALRTVLQQAFDVLHPGADDRPFGRDVAALRELLSVGWAHEVLTSTAAAPRRAR